MNETLKTETCDRTEDLMSVLYGEATDSETRQFHQHLRTCEACQKEMTSFGQLRESIEAWKLEALSGFTSSPVPLEMQPQRTKSALAAVRTFFDLSPLWLKGATAFATLLFVVFAVVAFSRLKSKQPTIAGYTEEQKNEIVEKALQEQKASFLASQQAKIEPLTPPASDHQPQRKQIRSTQMARGRRPLTRWEREQLAADLRLLQQDDDDGPELIIDRINDE